MPGRLFRPSDFQDFEGAFVKPFLADVSALITPEDDSVGVELTSILRQDGVEVAAFLRREVERELQSEMRSCYFAGAPVGDANEVGA